MSADKALRLPPFLVLILSSFLAVGSIGFSMGLRLHHDADLRSVSGHPQHPNEDDKKTILFVHFHKSGGTMVCSTVLDFSSYNVTDLVGVDVRNGPFLNCNNPLSGPNLDRSLFDSMQTCTMMSLYNRVSDIVAVEVPLQENMPCPGFLSFALIRNPIERVNSHMRAHRWTQDHIKHWAKERTGSSPTYYLDGYPIVNSMVIRQLLGRARFLDTTPVNPQDLEKAKHIVDKFDVFVPMEHLDHPRVSEIMQREIPEFYEAYQKRQKGRKNTIRTYKNESEFARLLENENKYDSLLYEYVLNKFGIGKGATV